MKYQADLWLNIARNQPNADTIQDSKIGKEKLHQLILYRGKGVIIGLQVSRPA